MQLTLQSQSRSAGFMKKRDVVNVSYYDKLLDEAARKLEIDELKERNRKGAEEFEQSFSVGSTERTITLLKESNVDQSEEEEEEEGE